MYAIRSYYASPGSTTSGGGAMCSVPDGSAIPFLTTAKQLSAVEIEFLGSRVFGEGITRLMVVMTWDEEPAEALV